MLKKCTNLRNIVQYLAQGPVRPFTVVQPNNLVRSWEEIPDNAWQYEKIKYTVPIQGRLRKKKEKLEFEKLRRKIIERMEYEQSGRPEKVEEAKDTDVLFEDHEIPAPRKYDRVIGKELYYVPRIDNLQTYNSRKTAYLTGFHEQEIHDERIASLIKSIDQRLKEVLNGSITDFQDPDFDPTAVLRQDAKVVELLHEIREAIPKTNSKLFPQIALSLGNKLRYKEDFAGVWEALEEQLFKVLHNYNSMEIAQLKFGLAGTFPKAGSPRLHKALRDLALEDIPRAGLTELMHIFHAFRLLTQQDVFNSVIQQFLSKGIVLVKNDPESVANLIYTYANCRTKKHLRSKVRDVTEESREANQLLDYLLPEIENAIPKLSSDGLVRLSLGLMLMRTAEYNDIVLKIERAVKKKITELDAFQTANLLYAFSKLNDGASGGKASFYTDFEKNVLKYQKEFNHLEKSRIFYAYTSRALLSKELRDKVFLSWIKDRVEHMDYAELANVAYGLMFIENTDRDIWRKFARNVSTQKYRCPVFLYMPLKVARFYIEMLFPKWDLDHYEDTCFDAERVFNTSRLEKEFDRPEYTNFTRIIRFDLNEEDVKVWLEWQNMFIIDFAYDWKNFGILLRKARDCLPYTNEARPVFKLKKKILEANHWSVLEVDWNEFTNMGEEKRLEWLKGEIAKRKEKTKKNEEINEYLRREEIDEFLEFYDQEIDLNIGRKLKEIQL